MWCLHVYLCIVLIFHAWNEYCSEYAAKHEKKIWKEDVAMYWRKLQKDWDIYPGLCVPPHFSERGSSVGLRSPTLTAQVWKQFLKNNHKKVNNFYLPSKSLIRSNFAFKKYGLDNLFLLLELLKRLYNYEIIIIIESIESIKQLYSSNAF